MGSNQQGSCLKAKEWGHNSRGPAIRQKNGVKRAEILQAWYPHSSKNNKQTKNLADNLQAATAFEYKPENKTVEQLDKNYIIPHVNETNNFMFPLLHANITSYDNNNNKNQFCDEKMLFKQNLEKYPLQCGHSKPPHHSVQR